MEEIIMRKSHLLFLWTTIVTLLLIACVTGKPQYDTGMELYADEKYQEAIAYLEQAIEVEPTNKQYRKALADIRRNLVAVFVSKAQGMLPATPTLTIDDIENAKRQLSKAQEIDEQDSRVLALRDSILAKERSLLSSISRLHQQAQENVRRKEWLKAYFQLQQIQSRYPNYENTSQMMIDAAANGSQDLYQTAKALYDSEDFGGSIQKLREAISLKGDHQPSLDLRNLAQERNSADFFVAKAEAYTASRDWKAAAESYRRALEYSPGDQRLMKLISEVQRDALEFALREAEEQLNSGWLYRAIQTYKKAVADADSRADFRTDSLRRNLVIGSNDLAERFKAMGSFGAAWFWYRQIESIEPEYHNLFFLTQEMEDRIKERVKKSIAVFDFNSPSNSSDAGLIVANNLITFLFKSASGDIKILERENLKSILEEMKLGQVGIVSQQTAKEMGRVYGIDVAIMGSVLIYSVDSLSTEGTKTVKQSVGTTIEDNIDYLNWKARHPDPSDSELAAAPPAKISVPKVINIDYKVSRNKKVAFLQIAFRIVDVTTGENIQVKTIERKKKVEDEASSGIPDAGIKFDPLDILSDTEIMQDITNEVVAELGREALKPLQNLETYYFEDGENLLRRRSELEATERFVDAIFDERLKMIHTSPLSVKATSNLEEIFRNYNTNLGN